jgi:hypothetical protein
MAPAQAIGELKVMASYLPTYASNVTPVENTGKFLSRISSLSSRRPLCVALILLAIDFVIYASAHTRQIASAVLLALLVMAVVRLATNATAARESNVLEHAPEMSSLSFPPSSLRR